MVVGPLPPTGRATCVCPWLAINVIKADSIGGKQFPICESDSESDAPFISCSNCQLDKHCYLDENGAKWGSFVNMSESSGSLLSF